MAFFLVFTACPPDIGRPLRQALLSKRPSSKEAPPARGWVPKRAVVVRVCETSGLLASVTENQALGSSLAPQGKDEGREAWSSTMPTVPWLPAPHSLHFLLENLLWVRGQKGGGPDCPSTTGLLPA